MKNGKAIHNEGGNFYNHMDIDIATSHSTITEIITHDKKTNNKKIINKIKYFFVICLVKYKIYEILIRIGVLREWFDDFTCYWGKILNGRPLNLNDFFILSHEYRKRQQYTYELEWRGPQNHIENWQQKDMIYYIFFYAYRLASEPIIYHSLWKLVEKKSKILEYGASLAPAYNCYRQFFNHLSCYWTLADLPTFPFHYAKYKYRADKQVEFITINADCFVDPLSSSEKYDVIIISTVLEHVDDPYFVCKYLLDRLSTGGLIVFDFIKASGIGLDTPNSVLLRDKALNYIVDNVEIIFGNVEIGGNVALCIGRIKRD